MNLKISAWALVAFLAFTLPAKSADGQSAGGSVATDSAPPPTQAPEAAEVSYDGKWTIRFKSYVLDNPQPYITVVIKGDKGVWNRHSLGWIDPCSNREMPVVVEARVPEGIAFRVEQNKVIPGCTEIKLALPRVNDNKLEARFDNGDLLTMTRD